MQCKESTTKQKPSFKQCPQVSDGFKFNHNMYFIMFLTSPDEPTSPGADINWTVVSLAWLGLSWDTHIHTKSSVMTTRMNCHCVTGMAWAFMRNTHIHTKSLVMTTRLNSWFCLTHTHRAHKHLHAETHTLYVLSLSVHLSLFCLPLSVHTSVCFCLSVNLCICVSLSVTLSLVCLSLGLFCSLSLPACLSLSISVCLSHTLSVCLSLSLSNSHQAAVPPRTSHPHRHQLQAPSLCPARCHWRASMFPPCPAKPSSVSLGHTDHPSALRIAAQPAGLHQHTTHTHNLHIAVRKSGPGPQTG